MSDIIYKIKVKIGQNEIDLEGDKDWVEAKLSEFKELVASSSVIGQPVVPTTHGVSSSPESLTSMPSTLAQLYREKGEPRKHVDKVMLISYWLTKVEKMDTYNISDILRCYDDARIRKPANISDIMNKVNSEYLLLAPDKDAKKAWRISVTGEAYVEALGT